MSPGGLQDWGAISNRYPQLLVPTATGNGSGAAAGQQQHRT